MTTPMITRDDEKHMDRLLRDELESELAAFRQIPMGKLYRFRGLWTSAYNEKNLLSREVYYTNPPMSDDMEAAHGLSGDLSVVDTLIPNDLVVFLDTFIEDEGENWASPWIKILHGGILSWTLYFADEWESATT